MTTIIIRALSHQFGVSYSKLSSLICWTEKGMLDLEGHPMRQPQPNQFQCWSSFVTRDRPVYIVDWV